MIKGAGDVYFNSIDLQWEGGMLLLSASNTQIVLRDELAENSCHACQQKLLIIVIFLLCTSVIFQLGFKTNWAALLSKQAATFKGAKKLPFGAVVA